MNENTTKEEKQLILEVLLESYRQRRAEIISFQDNYHKTVQLFLGGIFLLIGYILTTQSYIFILLISIIILLHTHIVFYNYYNVSLIGASALEIEYRINELLEARENPVVDYEMKWGGLTRHDDSEKTMKRLVIFNILLFIFSTIIGGYFFYLNFDLYLTVGLIFLFLGISVFEIDYCSMIIRHRLNIINEFNDKRETENEA